MSKYFANPKLFAATGLLFAAATAWNMMHSGGVTGPNPLTAPPAQPTAGATMPPPDCMDMTGGPKNPPPPCTSKAS